MKEKRDRTSFFSCIDFSCCFFFSLYDIGICNTQSHGMRKIMKSKTQK